LKIKQPDSPGGAGSGVSGKRKSDIMKTLLTTLMLIITASSLFAQVAPDVYWIEFKNKTGTPYTLEQPGDYLSDRALDRRERYNISTDSSDLPVNPAYIQAVEATGVEVINISKWLNGVVVRTTNTSLISDIAELPFVKSVNVQTKRKKRSRQSIEIMPYLKLNDELPAKNTDDELAYGWSSLQVYMHNGQMLHNAGFQGQGMLIAVTDAGFMGFDTLRAFDSLRINNQIVAMKNFVNHNEDIYRYSEHGTNVTSIIGGNVPDTLIGTAPKANFLLLVTEDAGYENIIEEINWSCGAEYADSMGADVINVSLGYFEYDNPYWSHQVAQLDGITAWVSKAANIASSRGMMVVVSAGNSGNEEIPYIGTPGDAPGVLTIGSVGYDSIHSDFSSVGPTHDGRIKPDVCGVGAATICQQLGGIYPGWGTSFSAPVISGMVTCLWQAHPEMTNIELMDAIREASHMYNTPDSLYGYGIPDFGSLHQQLNGINDRGENSMKTMRVFPNPFNESLTVQYNGIESDSIELNITTIDGSRIFFKSLETRGDTQGQITVQGLPNLPTGSYIVSLKAGNQYHNQKLIKTGN